MSSVGALSSLPRHVVTRSTSAYQLSTAVDSVRICARSSQRCLHNSSKYWTSVELTSSSDTVLSQPFNLSTKFEIRKVLYDPKSNSDLTPQIASLRNGRASGAANTSTQPSPDSEYTDEHLFRKRASQELLARWRKIDLQRKTIISNADTTELLEELCNHLTNLKSTSNNNRNTIDASIRRISRLRLAWPKLPIEQRTAWLVEFHDTIVNLTKALPANSKFDIGGSSSSKPQDVSDEGLPESSLTSSDAAVLEDSNQPTPGHSGSPMLQNRAHGRSCLVTGATSGIGYEVVRHLALEGATHIRIISRDLNRGEKALSKIKEETGRLDLHTEVMSVDLIKSSYGELAKALRPALREWPPIDTVVLCAGMSQSKLTMQTSTEDVCQILNTNLKSNIMLSGAFLTAYFKTPRPRDTGQKAPSINKPESFNPNAKRSFCLVSISSLLARKGGYGASVYAASKSGLIAYNRALTVEAGAIYKRKSQNWPEVPSFRINTVSPGYIDTPMTKGIEGEGKESLTDQIPLGRFGKAAEVADAVMFLIGNEYANNCEINLDGGLSAT